MFEKSNWFERVDRLISPLNLYVLVFRVILSGKMVIMFYTVGCFVYIKMLIICLVFYILLIVTI